TTSCSAAPAADTTWTIRDNAPALLLSKTATVTDNAPVGPSVGDVIRYSYSVSNTGNTVLTQVGITDTLPGLNISNPGLRIPTLAIGATNSTTFANYATYTVTAADITAGEVTNLATAFGTVGSGPGTITSNEDSVTVPMSVQATMVLSKTGVYDDGNRGF